MVKRRSDWPAAKMEALSASLRRQKSLSEDDASDALLAAISKPYSQVGRKGGGLAYALRSFKNMAASAARRRGSALRYERAAQGGEHRARAPDIDDALHERQQANTRIVNAVVERLRALDPLKGERLQRFNARIVQADAEGGTASVRSTIDDAKAELRATRRREKRAAGAAKARAKKTDKQAQLDVETWKRIETLRASGLGWRAVQKRLKIGRGRVLRLRKLMEQRGGPV